MPGRTSPFQTSVSGMSDGSDSYRYGFNGKENDFEPKNGQGTQQDYGMRIYDPRLGKFLSVDPLMKEFPWYTPYQFAGNKPIAFIDLDGGEDLWYMAKAGIFGKTLQNVTKGTDDGIEESLKGTWNYVSRDMWKSETWKQTGLFLEEIILSSSPHSSIYNPNTPRLDASVKAFEDKVINGDSYSRSKYLSRFGADVLTAYIGSKGLGNIQSFSSKFVKTPWSIAKQSLSIDALKAAAKAKSGATLYRIGTNGKSAQGASAQFWSLENPMIDPEGYAKKYNVPLENIQNADFIETATLKKDANFVTREVGEAPGSSNSGKGIEVVVDQGGTTNNKITKIKK